MATKTLTYYADCPVTRSLEKQFGSQLESITLQQKCLMMCVLSDFLGSAIDDENYTMQDSIDYQDPDALLGEAITKELLELQEERPRLLVCVMAALTDQLYDSNW